MIKEDRSATREALTQALGLKLRRAAEYHDFLESLRGRVEAGPLGDVLSMYPHAVILALRAADEADMNIRKIEDAMFDLFRRHVSRIREGRPEDEAQETPHCRGDGCAAAPLSGDVEFLELERLLAEQAEVKKRVELAIDEFRRREVERRVESESTLSGLVAENPALAAVLELRRKTYSSDVDYRLTVALHMTDFRPDSRESVN